MITAEQLIQTLKDTINSHTIENIQSVEDDIYKYPDKIREVIHAYEFIFSLSDTIKVEKDTTQDTFDSLAKMLPSLSEPIDGVYEKSVIFNKMSQEDYDALDKSLIESKNWGIIYNPTNSSLESDVGYYTYNLPIYYTDVYTDSAMSNLETTLYDTFIQGHPVSANAYPDTSDKYCRGNVLFSQTLLNRISVDFNTLMISGAKFKITRSSNYGNYTPININLYYTNTDGTITICDASSTTPVQVYPGETVFINLPSDILNNFRTKAAGYFTVEYSGLDYDNNYCVFDCSCQVRLYYEKRDLETEDSIDQTKTMVFPTLYDYSGFYLKGTGPYTGTISWDLSGLPEGAVIKSQKLSGYHHKQITTGPITTVITCEGKDTTMPSISGVFNVSISSTDTRSVTHTSSSTNSSAIGSSWFTDCKVTVTYTMDTVDYDVIYDETIITPTMDTTSFTIKGTSSYSSTINWICPQVPDGAIITSCVLKGNMTGSMTRIAATAEIDSSTFLIDGTYDLMPFEINYGTSNTINSTNVVITGCDNQATGDITFSDLTYVVSYRTITS